MERNIFAALESAERRKILRFIFDNPPVRVCDLIRMGYSVGAIYYHFKKLGNLIKQDEKDRYLTTILGKKAVGYMSLLEELEGEGFVS